MSLQQGCRQLKLSSLRANLNFLFSCHDRAFYDPLNLIALLLKRYIWCSKFKDKSVSFIAFKNKLQLYAIDLVTILKHKNKLDYALIWDDIYNSLLNI